MQTVRQKVLQIIATQALLDVAHLAPGATPDSLGIDSLGLVETVFAIEEEFDVVIPFNANEPGDSAFDISSIDTIVCAVQKLVDEKAGGVV